MTSLLQNPMLPNLVTTKVNKDKLAGVAWAVKQVMKDFIRLALTYRSCREQFMHKAIELILQQNT